MSRDEVSEAMQSVSTKLNELEYCNLLIKYKKNQDSNRTRFVKNLNIMKHFEICPPKLDNEFERLFSRCHNLNELGLVNC